MPDEISERQLQAFRRFLMLMPRGQDKEIELLLLKSHLLIEEQVRQIIKERLQNPSALDDARIECHQAICLAQAFFPPCFQPWLWDGLRKLNGIRNEIAHNAEPSGIEDRIDHLVKNYPFGYKHANDDKVARFEISMWSLFNAVAELVEMPSTEVQKLLASEENYFYSISGAGHITG